MVCVEGFDFVAVDARVVRRDVRLVTRRYLQRDDRPDHHFAHFEGSRCAVVEHLHFSQLFARQQLRPRVVHGDQQPAAHPHAVVGDHWRALQVVAEAQREAETGGDFAGGTGGLDLFEEDGLEGEVREAVVEDVRVELLEEEEDARVAVDACSGLERPQPSEAVRGLGEGCFRRGVEEDREAGDAGLQDEVFEGGEGAAVAVRGSYRGEVQRDAEAFVAAERLPACRDGDGCFAGVLDVG